MPLPYGPNNPALCVDDATKGTVAWTNPTNVYAADANYASCASYDELSHYLLATDFGFSIPVGKVITGVVVEHRAKMKDALTNLFRCRYAYLVVGGAITGDEKSDRTLLTTSYVYNACGGANDVWGCTLTPAVVNAADFGVAISYLDYLASAPVNSVYVDHIRITVYVASPPGARGIILI